MWFNFLVAGMGATVIAANGVLFLVAWEVMSLAAYFLVVLDDQPDLVENADESEPVQTAGWTYLVSAHLGAAFLLALFALLGQKTGTLELADMRAADLPLPIRNVLFLLALVGFGTKAGVWPLHVWLPDTYAAAPGPIPALLSGVMSKMGLYGLLRLLSLLGQPPDWWAWLLIGLGAAGAVFGILYALGQHNLKRVLACSSIENVGIILLGLGVGLLGQASGDRTVALLGLGGALFHIVNHSVCKSLLFLCSAAIEQMTGTLELDRLGGLLRRGPVLGCAFLAGAVAISGLPPFNCFASEFLVYLGAFKDASRLSFVAAALPLAVIAALALVGGLAAACFTRAFGIVFLGLPRDGVPPHPPSPPLPPGGEGGAGFWLVLPPALLAAVCLLMGLAAPAVADRLVPPLSLISGISYVETEKVFLKESQPLFNVAAIIGVFAVLLAGLVLLRWQLLRQREVLAGPTWGCGYTRPTPRMQYTASSYAQPLLDLFGPLLGLKRRAPIIKAYFPSPDEVETMATTASDPAVETAYRPVFTTVAKVLGFLHCLQAGRVQIYVLYIVLTLVVLLVANLGA